MNDVQNSEGYKKARAITDQIKKEREEREAGQQTGLAMAKKALAAAGLSPEAMAYAEKHASTGVDDLNTGVSVPQLRIHSVGVSTKNVLADGSEPSDGQIYHTGLQEAWDEVDVILLSIKKCRLEQEDEQSGTTVMKAHYLLAGMTEETFEPFVIYVKGMSYSKIWELEDQLKPYVTKRPGGIPLSMLKIRISSEKQVVETGKYKGQKKNVFKFSLIMHPSGQFPVLEGRSEVLASFDSATEGAESMLEMIISGRGMSEKEWNQKKKEAQEVEETTSNVQNAVFDGEVTEVEEPVDTETDENDPPF